jgi:hypothetical protein
MAGLIITPPSDLHAGHTDKLEFKTITCRTQSDFSSIHALDRASPDRVQA